MRWWPAHRMVSAVLGGVLVTGLLLVAPTSGTPRAAAEPARGSAPRLVTVTSGSEVDDVLDYWTSRRMEAARPLSLDANGQEVTSGAAPDTGRVAARSTAQALTPPRSVGKLFFTTPMGDGVCSAATVNTARKDVIITAAHCAHSGRATLLNPSRYYTNFLFVPRYAKGSAPDGAWVGLRAVTHPQWTQNEDLAYDQALIEVAPRGGRNVVDVVGGNGLAWGHPARQVEVSVWGWPAQAPYDGETARRCHGSTSAFERSADAKIACPMTGGSSGGPWYISMVNPHVGFIWAVTSRRTINGTPYLIARPLTRAIANLVGVTDTSGPATASTAAPVTARRAARPRVRVRALPPHVGRGQLLRLRARTARDTRAVLQVRWPGTRKWRRVMVRRTNGAGRVEYRQRPVRVGVHRYRVVTKRARSTRVRVRVHRCPLPADRTPSVVRATGCSQPVG